MLADWLTNRWFCRDKLAAANTRMGELQLEESRKEIHRTQRMIMELDNKTISEIKRYNHPASQVIQVMAAVCILLGEEPLNMLVCGLYH